MSISSLGGGRVADDFWHRAMLFRDRPWLPSPSGPLWLFSFLKGTEEEHRRVLESGFAGWFAAPGLRIAFFRPLSSLTHWVDYQLWPNTPALMHLHSVGWFLLTVVLAARVYRRFLAPVSPVAANIATLFYAIDHTHGMPAGWIANRNALIAAVFSLLTLLVHDNRRPFLTAGLFMLALCAGENSVGILFFLIGHALFMDDRGKADRIRALAPTVVVFAGWLVMYKLARFGVFESGVYQSPMSSVSGFVRSAFMHTPLLLGAELGALTPDAWPFLPPMLRVATITLSLLVILIAARVIKRTLFEHSDLRVRKVAGFFVVSAVLAVLPATPAIPAARLLVVPGVAFLGLLALICGESFQTKAKDRCWVTRAYAKWTWLGHLILAPPLFLMGLHQFPVVDRWIGKLSDGIPLDGSATNKRLVLVNAPDPTFAYYVVLRAIEHGQSPPTRMLTMTGNARDVVVKRSGERTFEVKTQDGFYRSGTDLFFRDPNLPLPVGTKIELSDDATVLITHALPDGIPDEARIELTSPLPLDEAYVFRKWEGNELVPFVLPAMGESVMFPGRMPALW